ncbi:MAG: hypothetical protein AAF386_03760 [Pseudomonadota bacterium]
MVLNIHALTTADISIVPIDLITKSVVTGMMPEIGAHERAISRRKPIESLTAWELCQRGMIEFGHRTTKGILNAAGLYHQAVKADPTYALPQALWGACTQCAFTVGAALISGKMLGTGSNMP